MLITTLSSSALFAQDDIVLPYKNQEASTANDTLTIVGDTIPSDSIDQKTISKIDTTISPDAIESTVLYDAEDSMKIDKINEKVYLYGNAQVNYENIQLNANYIEVDLKNNAVTANGTPDSTGKLTGLPVFKEGDQEYEAGKMTYNFETKKGKIAEVKTQEGEGFIKGNEVKKTGNDVMFIRDGYYTTCNLPDPHFSLATSKLKIIPGNKIITGPTVLKIDDIPTPLGLPFGFFPNKKGQSSGIIIPTYGDSRRLGFFLRNGGFYWGINEYIDASLTGDIYSLGSWGSNFNSRYKKRYKYNGNINLSYSKILNSYREFPDFSESNEFFVRWNHAQDSKARPGSRFSANVNVGSSSNFTNNLNSFSNDYLTNTFQSSITYSNSFPSKPFNLTVSARHNQNTQTGAFNVNLPDVSFNVSRQFPFKNLGKIGNEWWRGAYKNLGISTSSNATNQLQTNDTLLAFNRLGELQEDFRNGVQHSVPVSTSFKLLKHANVSPSLTYREVWAFKTIRREVSAFSGNDTTIDVTGFERGSSWNFNTSLTSKFYSLYQFRKGKIKALRHVLTPSVSYNYQPQINTGRLSYINSEGIETDYSIYDNGVYGAVNRTKSSSIGIGLLNNFEMKVKSDKDSTGLKKIKLLENLGFNTSHNLTADSLKWAPISMNGRTTIGQFLTLTFNGTFDPYALDSNESGTAYKVNESQFKRNGKLARFTSGSVALNFRLGGKAKDKKKPKVSTPPIASAEELEYINTHQFQYIDFNIPWSLNVGYNIRYSKPTYESTITQTLNFSGDLSLTDKWKIGATSGWDFESKDFTYTSLNINRDLHCWELAINWIPYGPRQSYNLTINVKSAVLQDLKLNRRRDYYDVIN